MPSLPLPRPLIIPRHPRTLGPLQNAFSPLPRPLAGLLWLVVGPEISFGRLSALSATDCATFVLGFLTVLVSDSELSDSEEEVLGLFFELQLVPVPWFLWSSFFFRLLLCGSSSFPELESESELEDGLADLLTFGTLHELLFLGSVARLPAGVDFVLDSSCDLCGFGAATLVLCESFCLLSVVFWSLSDDEVEDSFEVSLPLFVLDGGFLFFALQFWLRPKVKGLLVFVSTVLAFGFFWALSTFSCSAFLSLLE